MADVCVKHFDGPRLLEVAKLATISRQRVHYHVVALFVSLGPSLDLIESLKGG